MPATGRIDGIFDGLLRGWAWDPERPKQRLNLIVHVDGKLVGQLTASRLRGDLLRAGIGDGMHGLELALPLALQDGAHHAVALLLADTEPPSAIIEARFEIPQRSHMLQGRLERIADGRAIGWIWNRAQPRNSIALEFLVDGVVVGRGEANRFRNDLVSAGIGSGEHGFVFQMPAAAPAGALLVRATEAFGHWVLGTLPFKPVEPPRGTAPKTAPQPAPPRPERRNAVPPKVAPAPKPPPAPPFDVSQTLADARDAERRRDFIKAAEVLDNGLRRAAQNFDLLFLRARVALALQDLVTADRCARAALKERPGHVRPSVILARIATIEGNHADAIEFWDRVKPGDDNYRERLIKRGRSLLILGRALEALGEFAAARGLHAEDRDALLGLAESAEAVGSLAAALRHWRRYAEVVEGSPQALDRIATLTAALAPPQGLASPLRNPNLQQWAGPIEAVTDTAPVEPTPGVTLRSLAPRSGLLSFAATEPSPRRPGELPSYGLWLRAQGGEAEVSFALDPNAWRVLATGLRMGIALWVPPDSGTTPVELWLQPGDGPGSSDASGRLLLRRQATRRPCLIRFDLRLDAGEILALRQGHMTLALRLLGAGTLVVLPPRPLCVLSAAAAAAPHGAEDAAAIAGLRMLSICRTPRPPVTDPLHHTEEDFAAILLEATPDTAREVPVAAEGLLGSGRPILCLVEADPAWPEDVTASLRRAAAADPRLRLVEHPGLPKTDALIRLPAESLLAAKGRAVMEPGA